MVKSYLIRIKIPGELEWIVYDNVVGDSIYEDIGMKKLLPFRVLTLKDKRRIEVPFDWLVEYSKERFESIREGMEKASKQKVTTSLDDEEDEF